MGKKDSEDTVGLAPAGRQNGVLTSFLRPYLPGSGCRAPVCHSLRCGLSAQGGSILPPGLPLPATHS